jgi:hypothetical protein
MRTIVRNMDDVEFIRAQIRSLLSEEGGKETRTGPASRTALELRGRAYERPKEVLNAFGLLNFIPTGNSSIEKAASILRHLSNNDRSFSAVVSKIEILGSDIQIYPKLIEIEGEDRSEALIPVNRLAIYAKTLCIACWKDNKIVMDDPKAKQVKGDYGIVRGFK